MPGNILKVFLASTDSLDSEVEIQNLSELSMPITWIFNMIQINKMPPVA